MNDKSIAQPSDDNVKATMVDADYFQAMVLVEFLPGETIQAPVSVEFCDEALARHSLAHIQSKHPGAFLISFRSEIDDPAYDRWLEKYRKRDGLYRNKFLPNGDK